MLGLRLGASPPSPRAPPGWAAHPTVRGALRDWPASGRWPQKARASCPGSVPSPWGFTQSAEGSPRGERERRGSSATCHPGLLRTSSIFPPLPLSGAQPAFPASFPPPERLQLQQPPVALALLAGHGELDPSQLKPLNPPLLCRLTPSLVGAVESPAPSSCPGTLLQNPRNCRALGRGRDGAAQVCGAIAARSRQAALPRDSGLPCLPFSPRQAWVRLRGGGGQQAASPEPGCNVGRGL